MQYLKLGIEIFPLQEKFETKGPLSAYIDYDSTTTQADSFPAKKPEMSKQKYDLICKKMKTKYLELSAYLGPELLLPPKIKNTLLENMAQKIYTPDIFTRAYNYLAKTLEVQAWEPYNIFYSQNATKSYVEEGFIILTRFLSKIHY
jgi:hypothetical protein